MEKRKTKRANLENKKLIFFEIGMIITLLIILFAFEYKSYESTTSEFATREFMDIPEEIVPITEQNVKLPPPPPKAQVTTIRIVEDDVEVENDIIIDAEADDDTEIPEYEYVPVEEEEEEIVEASIFIVVESMPEYPGGIKELYKYLGENIKYPTIAKESHITGKVYVNFIVEKDGSISGVKILRGIGGGCDEEAKRIIANMPNWKPGKQRGKAVRVSYNIPVKFTLQ